MNIVSIIYVMEILFTLKDNEGKTMETNMDKIQFQKMVFLYNAINNGWTVKKKNDSYVFKKCHEGKKEVFLETYLTTFMKDNLNIQNLLK